jgi:adenosylcobinamide kinase/adenosylcobinamide-phosphate guanylyltransferase
MAVVEHIIVTGGSRSGKSEWAEQLTTEGALDDPICYVAPGINYPDDTNWQLRLEKHRQRRPQHWRLEEITDAFLLPRLLTSGSSYANYENSWLLIDSLGSWVALGLELSEHDWLGLQAEFIAALEVRCKPVVLVAEEVGWGVIPHTALGGLFRDRLGSLSRACARKCSESWLVCMGQALPLHMLARAVELSN